MRKILGMDTSVHSSGKSELGSLSHHLRDLIKKVGLLEKNCDIIHFHIFWDCPVIKIYWRGQQDIFKWVPPLNSKITLLGNTWISSSVMAEKR